MGVVSEREEHLKRIAPQAEPAARSAASAFLQSMVSLRYSCGGYASMTL